MGLVPTAVALLSKPSMTFQAGVTGTTSKDTQSTWCNSAIDHRTWETMFTNWGSEALDADSPLVPNLLQRVWRDKKRLWTDFGTFLCTLLLLCLIWAVQKPLISVKLRERSVNENFKHNVAFNLSQISPASHFNGQLSFSMLTEGRMVLIIWGNKNTCWCWNEEKLFTHHFNKAEEVHHRSNLSMHVWMK